MFTLIGIILLGFIALAFPFIQIIFHKVNNLGKNSIIQLISLSACMLCTWLISLFQNEFIERHDLSALLDTYTYLLNFSLLLIIATILLNIIALKLCKHKNI